LRMIKGNLIRLTVFASFLAISLLLFNCTDSTSPETGQGQLKLSMVDAPAGYDQVNIVVTRVEVHKSGADSNSGWFVLNNNSATYDLLTLRNGASVVLGNSSLDAGFYSQLRLIIGTGSNVVVNGVAYPLEIPSGEQPELTNHSFEFSQVNYELLLDLMLDIQ